MNIQKAIEFLDGQISNPSSGLPEKLFLFISRMTPLVNVDLLIKDEKKRILLSWRKEKNNDEGWHIPGGILRFKEKLEDRIIKVAENEIGAPITFNSLPVAIKQVICRQNNRGHFISLLYECFLSDRFIPKNTNLKEKDNGYLKWHWSFPENLLKIHKKIYGDYIKQYERQ